MRQSKVATRRGTSERKITEILRCVTHHPEGITPKMIALKTSINVNTIKAILPKISGIKKIIRGLYKVVDRGDGTISSPTDVLSDWNFHNAVLSTSLAFDNPKTTHSTHSFGLINLEFIISKSGNATLRIASDNPLNVSSICMVYGFFCELIERHIATAPSASEVYIRTIEFNKDYSNLRLDGVGCLTIDNLCEQFKIYQKKRGLRLEHKTKVNFTVENIVDMLTNNPNSLESNVKLANQAKQIERIESALVKTNALLYKLIDKPTS